MRKPARVSLITRFWQQVDKRGPDECWPWIGKCRVGAPGSYGLIVIGSRKEGAHRFSWEMANGPASRTKLVMHSCDNPPCVNPAHLSLGSHRDNSLDMVAKGRARGPAVRAPGGVPAEGRPFREWMIRFGGAVKVAAVLRVSTPLVYHWQNGRYAPTADMLERLVALSGGELSAGSFSMPSRRRVSVEDLRKAIAEYPTVRDFAEQRGVHYTTVLRWLAKGGTVDLNYASTVAAGI